MAFDRNKQFRSDLDFGKWGEGVMIEFITILFKRKDTFVSYWYSSDDITKSKKILKEWDMRFGIYKYDDRINFIDKFEVEIKTDKYKENTGNLIFEKSCGGKKSGVFVTKSKYFVYFLPLFKENNVYIIKSENLRELLVKYNDCITFGGDYGSNTSMYKIDRASFDDAFVLAGGKIQTVNNYTIPDKFDLKKFDENNKGNKVYVNGEFRSYEDPFDFG